MLGARVRVIVNTTHLLVVEPLLYPPPAPFSDPCPWLVTQVTTKLTP